VLELYGSKGSILAKGTIGQGPAGEMIAFLEQTQDYDAQQTRTETQGIVIAPEPINTYQAEIEEFGQAIIDDREPLIGAGLGLRSQKILAACYDAAGLGRAIKVD
jgi:predicted dehydrogenase